VNGEIPAFHFDLKATVQKYMNDRSWQKEAMAFYLHTYENLTLEKVGKGPKVKLDPSNVSRAIKRF